MNNTEGTRQISSVTSGEGVPERYHSRGNGDCLLKTQDFAKCIMMYKV